MRGPYRYGVGVAIAAALGFVSGASAKAPYGALTPLGGPTGCVARGNLDDGCAEGRGLNNVHSVVLSPDGRFLYAAAGAVADPPTDDGAIDIFSVDQQTGGIKEIGCLKNPAAISGAEGCALARNIEAARFVNVSPDGRFLYAGAYFGFSIFRIDPATGGLRQLPGPRGCFRADGAENCTKALAIGRTEDIRFTRDGRFAYAANIGYDSIVVFRRDVRTGYLTELSAEGGCSTSVHAAGDPDHQGCVATRGLTTPRGITLSPDERFLYVAAIDEAIVIFSRDPITGVLMQLLGTAGCIDGDGSEGCAVGRGIYGPHHVTLTNDGRFAIVAGKRGGNHGSAISIWRVNPRTGHMQQLPGKEGCISEFAPGVAPEAIDLDDNCTKGRIVLGAHVAVLDSTERTVYVASDRSQGGLAIFHRDPTTGTLTQLPRQWGCIGPRDNVIGCMAGPRQNGLHYLVLSQDERFAYAAGENSEAVIVYRRTTD